MMMSKIEDVHAYLLDCEECGDVPADIYAHPSGDGTEYRLCEACYQRNYAEWIENSHGVVRVSSRQEMVLACECSRHWRIIAADGHALEVERISGDDGEASE